MYTGGTYLNNSNPGYSMEFNFLSDLGRTISFSNNNTNLFISEYYTFVEFTVQKTFHSRAPPIS